MTPVRTVLDTNVLLSALLFPTGMVRWLRDVWRSAAILPLASRDTVSELVRVLCYPKFRLTDGEREDLLADYLPFCESISVVDPPQVPECRDPIRERRRLSRVARPGAQPRVPARVVGPW
ncbi:PIN domain-containing protein [Candidatus Palauibacter sp.]|uniref:PIN domain-containing protein n=1 Tax=Candidatus Palauibacter sp. TaxID=3101350 RepID=UPI003B01E8D7